MALSIRVCFPTLPQFSCGSGTLLIFFHTLPKSQLTYFTLIVSISCRFHCKPGRRYANLYVPCTYSFSFCRFGVFKCLQNTCWAFTSLLLSFNHFSVWLFQRKWTVVMLTFGTKTKWLWSSSFEKQISGEPGALQKCKISRISHSKLTLAS